MLIDVPMGTPHVSPGDPEEPLPLLAPSPLGERVDPIDDALGIMPGVSRPNSPTCMSITRRTTTGAAAGEAGLTPGSRSF